MIEIDLYGEELIENAYANPKINIVVDPIRYKKKVNRRKSNKSDKIAGEIVLSVEEKLESKSDEKLSEYETKITADQEKAEINLYKLSGVDNIMAFDLSLENWVC